MSIQLMICSVLCIFFFQVCLMPLLAKTLPDVPIFHRLKFPKGIQAFNHCDQSKERNVIIVSGYWASISQAQGVMLQDCLNSAFLEHILKCTFSRTSQQK